MATWLPRLNVRDLLTLLSDPMLDLDALVEIRDVDADGAGYWPVVAGTATHHRVVLHADSRAFSDNPW